jgi:hypothetical protein
VTRKLSFSIFIAKKGKDSWEKYEELEKRVDHRKNYEEYLKGRRIERKKRIAE